MIIEHRSNILRTKTNRQGRSGVSNAPTNLDGTTVGSWLEMYTYALALKLDNPEVYTYVEMMTRMAKCLC
jgi:hypothetical protein